MKWSNVRAANVEMIHHSTANVIEMKIGNQLTFCDTYDFEALRECMRQIEAIEKIEPSVFLKDSQ